MYVHVGSFAPVSESSFVDTRKHVVESLVSANAHTQQKYHSNNAVKLLVKLFKSKACPLPP